MSISVIRNLDGLQKKLAGDRARFYAFSAFLALVFFAGGSSRDDVQSLVFLRPIAVFFGTYALACMTRDRWKGRLFPLHLTLALAGLMVLQLIPLPPSVWSALPERQIFADIANLAGIEQPWRPLTLSPSRTLNSLFSLAVPISAMMLYLNLDEHRRRQAIAVIIILAMLSALWATFQLAGSSRGPFYLYRITNNGAAVGLFANRNHQAILLAATIIMLGWYAASRAPTARLAVLRFYGSIAALFVLVPLIFITGSRAGLVLMGPAVVVAMIFIYFGRFTVESQPAIKRSRGKKKRFSSRQIVLFGSVFTVLAIGTLSVYFSRSLAFDRLVGRSEVEGLRTQLFPTLIKMVGEYFPWGSGFGSFEYIYQIYEPYELLNPRYLNHAHNDWLQFPIEGGLPAVLIGVAGVVWVAIQFFRIIKAWRFSRYTKYIGMMAAMVMLSFLAGSVGDYPLRVPSIIVVFAVMGCILGDNARIVQQQAIKAET